MRQASQTAIKYLAFAVVLVVILPFVLGIAISPEIIAGLLPGVIVSGIQFSSSATTSGEAWQAAKKLVERNGVADDENCRQQLLSMWTSVLLHLMKMVC